MRFILGDCTKNLLLNLSNVDAAYRQSEEEHEEALNHFVKPDMSPEELAFAIQQGEEYEENLQKYWDDTYPREDLNAGSSWISEIEHIPDGEISIMNTKDGNQYTYPMDADKTGDWVTSDTGIGEYYNKFIKYR